MVAQAVPVVSRNYGTDSVGLRFAVQGGREDVCGDAARAGAGLSIVQGVAGKVCGVDGAAKHYSGAVPGAGAMGGAANARRGGARRVGGAVARII